MNPSFLHTIDELDNRVSLDPKERKAMQRVTETFPFRTNDYYLSLIDWKDRHDPLRRIVIPDPGELDGGGLLDPSCEKDYTKLPGLQHKYPQTGLLLLSDVCGGICRFCFRKRLFISCERETVKDVSKGLEYIRSHHEITNVLLSGGDPLSLDTTRLERILRELREIDHVNIIRIGSKMPAYNPYRILNDHRLTRVLSQYSTPEKRIYLMAHYNHPNEITDVSLRAIEQLHKAGLVIVNQSPILEGVNSSPVTLANLFKKLSFAGVSPYYVFQCRPSIGNRIFQTPVEKSYEIIQQAWKACSGLAKRARFIMSHATGKIEIVGRSSRYIFMRYHQAADSALMGKLLMFDNNPHARWLEDYHHPVVPEMLTAGLNKPRMCWLF
jgi:KamA family protein